MLEPIWNCSSTLKVKVEEKDDISPDERKIFLFFSKGYSILEAEGIYVDILTMNNIWTYYEIAHF